MWKDSRRPRIYTNPFISPGVHRTSHAANQLHGSTRKSTRPRLEAFRDRQKIRRDLTPSADALTHGLPMRRNSRNTVGGDLRPFSTSSITSTATIRCSFGRSIWISRATEQKNPFFATPRGLASRISQRPVRRTGDGQMIVAFDRYKTTGFFASSTRSTTPRSPRLLDAAPTGSKSGR